MYQIENDLPNHKCKTCDKLSYWDWYYCTLGKYETKEGFLSEEPLIECSEFTKRKGSNWGSCNGQDCIFWCMECPAYKNKDGEQKWQDQK